MMLVQKQPNFTLNPSPYQHHRRHPSAPPAVIVQPTRTPGLLSLSKPPRPSPQLAKQLQQHIQQPQLRQQQRVTPKSKAVPPPAGHHSPHATHAEPSTDIPDKSSIIAPSPDKGTRGRQPAKLNKSSATTTATSAHRSASHSSVRGRRNHGRQPSPSVRTETISSQAEALPPTSTTLSDPFLDTTPSIKPTAAKLLRAAPSLTSRPSGKLANRRRQPLSNNTASPTPTPAVSVPRTNRRTDNANANTNHNINNGPNSTISRSDPAPSHMPLHLRQPRLRPIPTPKRSLTSPAPSADFPICDDMTEVGDHDHYQSDLDFDTDTDINTPPVTPTRPPRVRPALHTSQKIVFPIYDDGPRTAPLSSAITAFPFSGYNTKTVVSTPSPASRAVRPAFGTMPSMRHNGRGTTTPRNHRRTPSEGIFAMSSDEDSSSSSASEELKALFGLKIGKGLQTPTHTHTTSGSGTPGTSPSRPTNMMTPKERAAARELAAEKAAAAAGYFASSMFQNSPSPEELPPPRFV